MPQISFLCLIKILFFFNNVEVADLISLAVGGDNTEDILHRLLLQELLCKILQITLRELLLIDEDNLVSIHRHRDWARFLPNMTSLTINLDSGREELRLCEEEKHHVT
eukprot:TRINITY_DN11395_c0_g1_i1.p2 TRINITY_DN11395_c0_g1~~TRINITY_DN11395_c0_g1_i1.p2  ORF type:complete len:108 (+),score=16.67 TRINITY_DN11395_c0_g1_i1:216-539(+)